MRKFAVSSLTQSVKLAMRVFGFETDCETRQAIHAPKKRTGWAVSGGVDFGFVDQQNRNVVAHRIYPAALSALQALAVALQSERFFTKRANQNVEQVLRNHERIVLHKPRLRSMPAGVISTSLTLKYWFPCLISRLYAIT
jgi:hypothetical protein